jgi:hypothetical protein
MHQTNIYIVLFFFFFFNIAKQENKETKVGQTTNSSFQ